jgi:hypothetical protein
MPIETIYMPLMNENVTVWAPVQAENLGGNRFRVLGPMPDADEWAFGPGSIVNARVTRFSGCSLSNGPTTLVRPRLTHEAA